ncbi:uncharacterized protein J3D65DRAFT_279737 [Phyllosticta citribraziliensis]|uniref:Uncharacterized protein n=1 Tax=Phyllosticta citribraziliensis TaxID=989973 RepID=A0ABR1LW48_9PEZI
MTFAPFPLAHQPTYPLLPAVAAFVYLLWRVALLRLLPSLFTSGLDSRRFSYPATTRLFCLGFVAVPFSSLLFWLRLRASSCHRLLVLFALIAPLSDVEL